MNILVLATTFPAEEGDGTPEFVLTLSAALARGQIGVTVLAPRVRGAPAVTRMAGVEVRRFAYFPKRWEALADGAIMANLRSRPSCWVQVVPLMLAFAFGAWRVERSVRPDVIHAHWIVPAGVIASGLRLLSGTPYVVTVHGADAYTLTTGFARRIKRSVVRRSASTVPVSEAIGAEIAALAPVVSAVPMGVDVASIRTEVGRRRPVPGRILFIGRLVEKKGVDVLCSAIARIPGARLAVAGGGPLLEQLHHQVEATGTSHRVELLGACSRSEVMAQLAMASVVAIPSRVGADGDQDGVPVVLAEAMAAGVPVVASRQGGLSEHVSDGVNGLLVKPGSTDDLVEALGRLIADPALADGWQQVRPSTSRQCWT